MKEQVLSTEQMQELIDMGIDVSKASMCWEFQGTSIKENKIYYRLLSSGKSYFVSVEWNEHSSIENIPTFTIQDILEMLPKPYYLKCIDNGLYQCKITRKNGWAITSGNSPLNAAFNMLKWCKQHNEL